VEEKGQFREKMWGMGGDAALPKLLWDFSLISFGTNGTTDTYRARRIEQLLLTSGTRFY